MHRTRVAAVVTSLSFWAGCRGSDDAGDGAAGTGSGTATEGPGSTAATSPASSSSTTGTTGTTGTATAASSTSGASTAASTSSGSTSDTAGATTGGGAAGCPDPLPADWIFCEDFEDLVDPADRFFEYNDGGGRFVLADDAAYSGDWSMRATFEPGVEGTGWMSVAFGVNPAVYGGKPHIDPNGTYEEIWWRLRLRMEPGWPDVGPAKVTRATSIAKDDWGQAMIAHLWSAGSDVTLLGDPASCVQGGVVVCNGYNDFANLSWLGQMNGTSPLFSSAWSGTFHCIEGHVRLNTPGASDGVFEFWIDGNLENARNDLDWRGTYEGHGINLVSFENYWNGGPPATLQRWIDDVAIATVPIGCD